MQSPPYNPRVFFILALLVICPVVVQAFYRFASAWLSGWMSLASRYRARQEPSPQERLDLPSWVRVPPGLLSRRLALRICFIPTRSGLYLSAGVTNRAGRPPLLLPWKQVHLGSSEESEPSTVDLILGNEEPMLLSVKEGFGRKLALWKSHAVN
jgi:hypothetical protein